LIVLALVYMVINRTRKIVP